VKKINKILVANRGEIAIRVMRAANELGKSTVAIFAEEDKLALHRFKADEAYLIHPNSGPVHTYLDIDAILRIAHECNADAIHPGYGFLSENPEFAERTIAEGLTFIGPTPKTMRLLGNKVSAREVAIASGVPVVGASQVLPDDLNNVHAIAEEIGYPMMLKASWGGGGRGMRTIHNKDELERQILEGRREAELAFGNAAVYLEKFISRACHVEVQILGDKHNNLVHLFERDCSIQRRNQKVVERAPAPYLNDDERNTVCQYALKIAKFANYECAGTVEFLMDKETQQFFFIEVNPRIQVEHTVTEEITGIDIVKAQIRLSEGEKIGECDKSGVPNQEDIKIYGHAVQCRVTTEDSLNNFIPDYGRISAYRVATGFGIRLDGGTAYTGALITPHYDSLLEKITSWGNTALESIQRMDRALREFRIRGVETNLPFLLNIINHPDFPEANYSTRFIDSHKELFKIPSRRDRATRILKYIAEITVNSHPDVANRPVPASRINPVVPDALLSSAPHKLEERPTKSFIETLKEDGPEGVRDRILSHKNTLVTDTTMRDAHQSLLATRMRSYDMVNIAQSYTKHIPHIFSMECWGGATFDVCMRFLQECPWERLRILREKMPNHLLQMLIRGSSSVGYTNYPDNVVRFFIRQAARSGIDVFRIFDSLNWIENMRVSIDTVLEENKICEAAICYTGNLEDSKRSKYTLDYYIKMAKELQKAGAHIIGIKDMAGLLLPAAASELVHALIEETGLPIHLHTHDTSGIGAATIYAAVNAGVHIIDLAMDSLSAITSQPPMGSIVKMLEHHERSTGISPDIFKHFNAYWQDVRKQYQAFESGIQHPDSLVFMHEMPGGQTTNLHAQARSMGISDKWDNIVSNYAEVNKMFGDIVKVTPSSKVVGDMALAMTSAGLTREDVENVETPVNFPDSVFKFFQGELGQPYQGFPHTLQKKILKNEKPMTERAGACIPPLDLEAKRIEVEQQVGRDISDNELASYIIYPDVFINYAAREKQFGPTQQLPTNVFFYGMEIGEGISVELETGKNIVITLLAKTDVDDKGQVKLFFELNGQPRSIRIQDHRFMNLNAGNKKADPTNCKHVGASVPGKIVHVHVLPGQEVHPDEPLVTISAMKMEVVVYAEKQEIIKWVANIGTQIEQKDLLVEYN